MGASGSFWEPLGASGTLWEPLGASGILWEPLEASGSLWEPLGTSWELWEPLGASGSLSAPLGAFGSLWELLGASGNSWEPLGQQQQQQQQQQHYPVRPYKALQGYFKGGPALLPSPPAAPDTVLILPRILPRILARSGARKVRDPGQSQHCHYDILGHCGIIIWGHFLVIFGVIFLDHFLEYVNNRFNRLKNVCIRSYKAS